METVAANTGYETGLQEYVDRERSAVDLINSVGQLMYGKGVELVFFRNHLLDIGISEVIKLFNYADQVVKKPIEVQMTADVARGLLELDLAPSKIDIGRLTHEFANSGSASINDFLKDHLSGFIGQDKHTFKPQDVILYGFGRIGRIAARELVKQAGKGQQLRLRAIVTRTLTDAEIVKRAALLRNDSVHGSFKGTVIEDVPNKAIWINGQLVQLIAASNPEDIDYTQFGIQNALVIDNTGAFTKRADLERHLKSKGVGKVLLTAPGKEIPNIVYGINHKEVDIENERIFSAASCTTNAICPILKVVEDSLGIEKGHIETVHAYTNDQNLLDNYHKGPRRGRSAAINMVITSTGAGTAVSKAIPSLKDKLTANAVRVPTPNGSLAIMNLTLKKPIADLDAMNGMIREAALVGELVNQIHFQVDPELVSSDIIGDTCCSVFDSNATIVSPDGKSVVLYTWYDNEFGYTKQVIRLAKHVTKVRRLVYY
ncbi:MAG: glyceraldehyde-3-phosphate dehydrogenase [Flavobacteriales bacterium]|jgi:glyceraldehyde 3-phosphate dehydrogenase|nr:glyceraldehyde-3-phosphate dehydrogenase [Flavobacteriales bacterium]MBK6551012.1 glyceraldehyde-3-phosphate dehydrogenase [Flavobacteriales bacterium]MBK6882569.1 glyceraldehyde-3-phosphate dehydrogenase [Flavobacteriales bacterium]MBK7103607.1 glyceraldehyde-3-phosphate dehydrogenase [Flavobacteriales bacterium]MBK7111919.1 glyceraldehyde-3-phosphate dehydrogenase [Flavobacteriales bacterium]